MTDPGRFLADLADELGRVGIRGTHRRRILDEFADHLDCDPGAELGGAPELAAQFADELGTSRARSSAFAAFAALAVAGVLLVVRIATFGSLAQASGHGLDTAGLLVCVVAAQVAFVAGGLALVRGLRLRTRSAIPAEEARILVRRAGVGLTAGAVATLSVPLRAAATPAHAGSAWLSIATVAVSLTALALATPAVIRARRVHPVAGGPAGDLFDDMGPVGALLSALTGGSTTRLARLIAAGLFLLIASAGWLQSDGYDGMIRAAYEAAAFYGGFALLGRYLGLRRR